MLCCKKDSSAARLCDSISVMLYRSKMGFTFLNKNAEISQNDQLCIMYKEQRRTLLVHCIAQCYTKPAYYLSVFTAYSKR